jgi:diaminopimelate decarboxylase
VNDTTFSYRNLSDRSELYCEDVALAKLVTEFGTPLYVYSQTQLLKNFRSLKESISKSSKDNFVSYALKANSNIEILRLLSLEGAGASVVSGGELRVALRTGFDPNKITFDGPGKTDEEITYALKSNIYAIDVESLQELHVINEIAGQLGVKARICIRVNPHIDAKTHPYISTGLSENKFGIAIDDSVEAYRIASTLPNIEITGIHCHIGSQITDLSVFIESAESIEKFVRELKINESIVLKHINFGGGQAVTYHNVIQHSSLHDNVEEKSAIFSIEDYAKIVMPILMKTGCTINIEPGRSIVANSGVLLTNVLYTKSNGNKNFVIVDAGMNDLIRPSLYHAYHQIVPVSLHTNSVHNTVDIVGPICETGDFLAQDRNLPIVRRGDLLAVMCIGAYGYVLASNYNLRTRAAEILISGNSYHVIRERELVDDIIV